jgi:hypothetical protein
MLSFPSKPKSHLFAQYDGFYIGSVMFTESFVYKYDLQIESSLINHSNKSELSIKY